MISQGVFFVYEMEINFSDLFISNVFKGFHRTKKCIKSFYHQSVALFFEIFQRIFVCFFV
jgi:hypothetical protein